MEILTIGIGVLVLTLLVVVIMFPTEVGAAVAAFFHWLDEREQKR